MQRHYFTLSILILTSFLMSYASPQPQEAKAFEDYRMPTDIPVPIELTQTAKADIAAKTPPKDSPVTTLSKQNFEAPEPYSPVAPWDGIFWFGSDYLWTALQNVRC